MILFPLLSTTVYGQVKDWDFKFNIRWSKSLSDYNRGKLAAISETYEEVWTLELHNHLSAKLSRKDKSVEVDPIFIKSAFSGIIRVRTADFEKFLNIYSDTINIDKDSFQLVDLKFQDYYGQKFSFKVDNSNTTLLEITVLPEVSE